MTSMHLFQTQIDSLNTFNGSIKYWKGVDSVFRQSNLYFIQVHM